MSMKEEMIDKLFKSLQEHGETIRNDKDLSNKDIAEQLNVLINTMHFLQDYDENIKVLNEYWLNKRQQDKYRKAIGFDHEDK